MKKQNIIFSKEITVHLREALEKESFDQLFLITDTNTSQLCKPIINEVLTKYNFKEIVIKAEDINKNLKALGQVWMNLSTLGATRHSFVINLGGGMVTDLGGFAASTFKRGINYLNIPTTLLSMVDASVGGKTGINFNGLKNEIGAFSLANSVIIDSIFLKTIDHNNLLSGFAEMLKHGFISNEEHLNKLLSFNLDQPDLSILQDLIRESIEVKESIVLKDPHEKGIRKALNFGHTIGHAFESYALTKTPVLHGYAVAWGLIGELYISFAHLNFSKDTMQSACQFIKRHYGTFYFDCKSYDKLYEFMTHDKKNNQGKINFTLLKGVGKIEIDQTVNKELIFETFDFFRECMGF